MKNIYYVTIRNYVDIGLYAIVEAKPEGVAVRFDDCQRIYPFTSYRKAEKMADKLNIAFRNNEPVLFGREV